MKFGKRLRIPLYASFLVIVRWYFLGRVFFRYLNIVVWDSHIWRFFWLIESTSFGIWRLLFSLLFFTDKVFLFFTDSFVQKTTHQSDGSCDFASDTQFEGKSFKNQRLFSAIFYEKNLVINYFSFAHHMDKLWFLPSRKYQIKLRRDTRELLQKSDWFCFTYKHVDCLYTLSRYRVSGKMVSRVDKCSIRCRKRSFSIRQTKHCTECPASRKTDSWRRVLEALT